MSGHSKWATTKHKKAAIDAKRGKLFAKLIKNIEVAAKQGGGDPAGNPTLFDAIQKAKKSSVPNKNIDSAVKRGSGAESGGVDYETISYEVYGPQGVAILIECLTDNRNRAAMEVRTAVTRNGGTMADPGSVSRLFDRKGIVVVTKAQESREVTEDDLLEATLDAGAEEVTDLDEAFQVQSEATDVVAVRTALQEAGIDYDSADVEFVASMEIPVDADAAAKVLRLVDALEDLDDVQDVFTNVDIPAEVMAELEAADA
ncbi:YebC/PmpR family DNA-binding transcriptional regulator [Nocardioides seonyuensis]|uniref:Probable transcriptional regulatory protein EXE58_18540 n=1 Tax=Nocardioides seonyuensis TaxID=2518371 RepID=A0A4P7IIQ9_9ACTN|nr:YebC/PmpR family DNA-binding transcriptional regulator [Nocardioides seonyuensis]QBX57224.1 YebC/PmpR family DNA-binding transcriptional regulator [Nocardioides seonyuensis]